MSSEPLIPMASARTTRPKHPAPSCVPEGDIKATTYHASSVCSSMGSWRLISFTFPASSFLTPGNTCCLCYNRTVFKQAHSGGDGNLISAKSVRQIKVTLLPSGGSSGSPILTPVLLRKILPDCHLIHSHGFDVRNICVFEKYNGRKYVDVLSPRNLTIENTSGNVV